MLHADIKYPGDSGTEALLTIFANKCTALTYLNVNCYDKLLCSGRVFSTIVTGCPKLQTLVVNKYNTVGGSSRDLAAALRPELTILVHNNSTAYDILSMSAR